MRHQPRSEYHFGVSINSRQSFRTFCDIPLSSTTDDNGLRLRGWPKRRHSEPIAVYKSVFPSVYCNANSLAVRTGSISEHEQHVFDQKILA